MKTIKGGITAPQGFTAAAIHSGIKRSSKKDLALIFSEGPASCAGVFTTNKVKAAPIIVSQENIRHGRARAVICNSGNANACTGKKGMEDARTMANAVAAAMHVPHEQVLVASTGTIGRTLPMQNILSGIRILSKKLTKAGGEDAANAILTTDLRKKEIAVQIKAGSKTVKIGGITKGSGMINPDMSPTGKHATMLCFITTDAEVPSGSLSRMLAQAVDRSFNAITVDNDTSTNDCVFILANGMSKSGKLDGKASDEFYAGLEYVCKYLAREIARDGEGATKLLEVQVAGAKSDKEAMETAKSVTGSSLVKSAIFGEDPNFGRIMAAIGYSRAEVDPDRVKIWIGSCVIVEDGKVVPFDAAAAKEYMKKKEIVIKIDLGLGRGKAVSWGCDLTYNYVKINAKYST